MIRTASARILAALAMGMLLLPGLASANHTALYYTELPDGTRVDPGFGRTTEDDNRLSRTPGVDVLDGLQNRVTQGGATPGSGGLFLDARVAQRISGTNAATNYVFLEGQIGLATGRSNYIMPGPHGSAAWYGWWNDKNLDGVIDDVRGIEGSGADEFVWRGRASGEEIPMVHYVYPVTNNKVTGVNNFNIFGLANQGFSQEFYKDYTDDPTHQAYITTGGTTGDAWSVNGPYDSILVTITQITVANPAPGGNALRYNFNDPDTLIDVDVYEGITPEAETLYMAAMTTVKPTVDEHREGVNNLYFGPVAHTVKNVTGSPGTVVTDAVHEHAEPFHAKEPNTWDDDYGGLAFHGGIGDAIGSYNQYPGYQSGAAHFFLNAEAKFKVVFGNLDNGYAYEPLPSAGTYSHDEQARLVFGVKARMLLWNDVNGDGYVGAVCDPKEFSEWDAARNACRSPEPTGATTGSESIGGLCGITPKDPIRVEPVGGNWPGVIVERKQGDADRISSDPATAFEVHVDAEPILLDWRPCAGNSGTASTSDVIIFPVGNPTIAVRTVMTVTSAAFTDSQGITYPPETITDVDIYHPVL